MAVNEERLSKCALGVGQAVESASVNVQWHARNFNSISRTLKIFTNELAKDI